MDGRGSSWRVAGSSFTSAAWPKGYRLEIRLGVDFFHLILTYERQPMARHDCIKEDCGDIAVSRAR